MASKNKKKRIGVVYSTDPDFEYRMQGEGNEGPLPEPAEQKLRVLLDRKGRKGKVVTVVTGFRGPSADREALGKKLKKACGVGGSVKDEEILVQGDHRDRVVKLLLDEGYAQTKKSGG